jgi:Tol biopolymer transport system component
VSGEWPAWSPDERRIAFQRDGSIHLIAVDGSGETVLGEGREPAWAPDGNRLAFAGAQGIAVMQDDGSGATTLLRHDFRDDTHAESDMARRGP